MPTASPTMAPTTTDRMLYCGVPSKCEGIGGDEVVANMNTQHVVRCCTENVALNWFDKCLTIQGIFGQTPNECYMSKTFSEAMQICASYDGGRLCTGEEMIDKCTAGTGCGANTKLAWGCTAFEGTCMADAECCSGDCNQGSCLDVRVDTAQVNYILNDMMLCQSHILTKTPLTFLPQPTTQPPSLPPTDVSCNPPFDKARCLFLLFLQ